MNFIDKKTGDVLSPRVKWYDPYGEIREKPLEIASWLELYEFSMKLWKTAIAIEDERIRYRKDKNTYIGLIVLFLIVASVIFVMFCT